MSRREPANNANNPLTMLRFRNNMLACGSSYRSPTQVLVGTNKRSLEDFATLCAEEKDTALLSTQTRRQDKLVSDKLHL